MVTRAFVEKSKLNMIYFIYVQKLLLRINRYLVVEVLLNIIMFL